jgi:iron complex outermembrane receptor protein
MKSTTFRTMLLCAAVPIAFIAEPVLAQDQPETEASEPAQEEITVTGSLIARSDATAFAPVSVFSAADIVDSGSLSVSEVLRSDPAIGAGSRGPTNTINGNGIQTLDLRSLGNRRTLVLLNGRRFPIYADSLNNAGQDVSAIPTGLIKRIDVLRDGASTTYGADAVAGVVNFILADKFDGVELSGLSGITGAGDGATYRLAGKVGIASDRGSLVVSGQYQKQESIPLYSRSWARDGVQLIGATSVIRNQSITPGGRVVSAAGATLACYPEAGGASVAPACPTFDAARQLDLTVGSTNYSFGAAGQYEVTDAIKLDIQGFYNSRESAFGIPATNINTSGSTGPFPNILIPATSSNNRFGQPIAVRVNLFDYGARINRGDADTVWLSGGLSGTVFGRFNWQVAQTYGQTKALNEVTNQVNTLNLQRLLIPSACVADSICAPIGAIPDIAAFLSHQTPLSAAQRNYLFYTETTRGKFVSAQTLATISGPLFELPGGSASIAVGLEHRVEQGETSVDAVTRSGAAATLIQPGGGKFKTNEIFGEINLPLLAGLPFASELTVNLQAR